MQEMKEKRRKYSIFIEEGSVTPLCCQQLPNGLQCTRNSLRFVAALRVWAVDNVTTTAKLSRNFTPDLPNSLICPKSIFRPLHSPLDIASVTFLQCRMIMGQ